MPNYFKIGQGNQWLRIFASGDGGGVTQTFSIRGCAILALNIAPINPAALPKKDTHKSGKQEPRKALTTVSSMRKAGKIILRQFVSKVLTHKSGEGLKWHPKIQRKLKMTPINPKSAQKRYPRKWHIPVSQHMEVTPLPRDFSISHGTVACVPAHFRSCAERKLRRIENGLEHGTANSAHCTSSAALPCFRPCPKEHITAVKVSIAKVFCERLPLSKTCVTM